MRKILIVTFLAGFSLLSPANTFAFENYKIISRGLTLNVQARELIAAQVKSGTTTRGAALAILQNGNYLLGGGNNGNQIFIYDTQMKKLTNLGAVFSQQATNDARFAITDIEPLLESASGIKALVSFPKLQAPANCVRVQVDRVDISKIKEFEDDSDILIGAKGRLFEITTSDFGVIELTQAAIGTGYQYALGSLHSTVGQPALDRIASAMGAAVTHSPQCMGPIDILVHSD